MVCYMIDLLSKVVGPSPLGIFRMMVKVDWPMKKSFFFPIDCKWLMELLGVDLERLNIDVETYQEDWAGFSLHSQKLLSRGLAEKLGNTVFKVYTLSVKIKALKFVDRDRIWIILSIIVCWLKFVFFFLVVSFTFLQYHLFTVYHLFFLDEMISLLKD